MAKRSGESQPGVVGSTNMIGEANKGSIRILTEPILGRFWSAQKKSTLPLLPWCIRVIQYHLRGISFCVKFVHRTHLEFVPPRLHEPDPAVADFFPAGVIHIDFVMVEIGCVGGEGQEDSVVREGGGGVDVDQVEVGPHVLWAIGVPGVLPFGRSLLVVPIHITIPGPP